MVFQNKGGMRTKQQTPAKQKGKRPDATDFFEMDSDDSVDNSVMKKTPQGKQSQVDKRVSFQMPGKNSPSGKAAKNENSFGKKQLTPGRTTALKEFKGMLAQNSAKNKSQEEQDSDDDDDDEDDDEDADLDILLGGDDDDDDEDEDDDDDDEEEEEEKQSALKKKQNPTDGVQKKGNSFIGKTPQKSNEKTPVKKVDKNQKNQEKFLTVEDDDEDDDDDEEEEDDDEEEEDQQKFQPKKKQNVQQNQTNALKKGSSVAGSKTPQKSPKKEKQIPEKRELQIGHEKALELADDRRRARDAKALYIGGLPKDVTQAELQALSTDITHVNIPHTSKSPKAKFSFAFLEFSDESKAEENYKLLKNKKLRGQSFKLDFAGVKSQNQNRDKKQNVLQDVNTRKLFVSSLSPDVTMDKIGKLFPKAFQVSLSVGQLNRTAIIQFVTDRDAAEAIEATSSAEIDGRPITVVYSSQGQKSKKRKKSRSNAQQNKKMKLNNKPEVDDDDDDDNDDDEE